MKDDAGIERDEWTVEVEAKVRYTEDAPSEEIARHNAEQEFIFDVDANLDDIEIVSLRAVDDCSVDTDSERGWSE